MNAINLVAILFFACGACWGAMTALTIAELLRIRHAARNYQRKRGTP